MRRKPEYGLYGLTLASRPTFIIHATLIQFNSMMAWRLVLNPFNGLFGANLVFYPEDHIDKGLNEIVLKKMSEVGGS